jgi:phage shock protein C
MKKLVKSRDRKLSGVLGGIAEYMGVDPTAIRLLFVFLAIFTVFFPCVIAYFIAAILMPER